jgi:hypothetical protein
VCAFLILYCKLPLPLPAFIENQGGGMEVTNCGRGRGIRALLGLISSYKHEDKNCLS